MTVRAAGLARMLALLAGVAGVLPVHPAAAQLAPPWVSTADGPAGFVDSATALAVNAVNGAVNVTGFSARSEQRPGRSRNYDYFAGTTTGRDYLNLAYAGVNASTS